MKCGGTFTEDPAAKHLAREDELAKQDSVECDDDGHGGPPENPRAPCTDKALHDVGAASEKKKRDEGEWQREAEDDL